VPNLYAESCPTMTAKSALFQPSIAPLRPSCRVPGLPHIPCKYFYKKGPIMLTIGPVSPLAPHSAGNQLTHCGSSHPYRKLILLSSLHYYTRILDKSILFVYVFEVFFLLMHRIIQQKFPLCLKCNQIDIKPLQNRNGRLPALLALAEQLVQAAAHADNEPVKGDHGHGEEQPGSEQGGNGQAQ